MQNTVQALKEHRRKQAEQRLAVGEHWAHGCEPDMIFTTETGTYPRQSNLHRRHFKPILNAAGLPDMRMYDLRHSAATILLALGENPKVVQERLGHRDVSLTLSTYSHVLEGLQQQATAKLEQALGVKEATPASLSLRLPPSTSQKPLPFRDPIRESLYAPGPEYQQHGVGAFLGDLGLNSSADRHPGKCRDSPAT